MMLYTSYFANLRNIPREVVPIAICAKAPTWYKGKKLKKLAPSYSIFMEWKEEHDEALYTERFRNEVLAERDPRDIFNLLLYETRGNDAVLLCFEKPSDFCHRHLVAEWLTAHGYPCEEWNAATYKPQPCPPNCPKHHTCPKTLERDKTGDLIPCLEYTMLRLNRIDHESTDHAIRQTPDFDAFEPLF